MPQALMPRGPFARSRMPRPHQLTQLPAARRDRPRHTLGRRIPRHAGRRHAGDLHPGNVPRDWRRQRRKLRCRQDPPIFALKVAQPLCSCGVFAVDKNAAPLSPPGEQCDGAVPCPGQSRARDRSGLRAKPQTKKSGDKPTTRRASVDKAGQKPPVTRSRPRSGVAPRPVKPGSSSAKGGSKKSD